MYKEFLKTYRILNRLNTALKTQPSDMIIDVSIYRFKHSFDFFCKLLKEILESEGLINVSTPKSVLIAAYTGDLIEDEKAWIQMLEDRKNTSEAYEEKIAQQIFSNLNQHYTLMQTTFDTLCKKFDVSQEMLERESAQFN